VVVNQWGEIERAVEAIGAIIAIEKGSNMPGMTVLENQAKQQG
jgi:hypothetical protein